ncbi:MAG: hypothetical protein ACK5Y2_05845 [Bdellovibrionales bacterium]
MKVFLTLLLILGTSLSVTAAERSVLESDLDDTCWANAPGGSGSIPHWLNFIFRSDKTGEMRKVDKYGARVVTEFTWSLVDSSVTYIFREPQSGTGNLPAPGSGRKVKLTISENGNYLYFANTLNGEFSPSTYCPY